MRVFCSTNENIGDNLNQLIFDRFGMQVEPVGYDAENKLLGVGSILDLAAPGDTILGSGSVDGQPLNLEGVRVLAVRGKLTRDCIFGTPVPDIYGDPALLLPLIWNPIVKKRYKVGIIPHYADKALFRDVWNVENHFIDIQQDWRTFVQEVKECRHIISSSLHGIVIAEAYGITAEWASFSNNVIGGHFKFHDYLTGTHRKPQGVGQFPRIPNLKKIQNRLIKAIKEAQR